MSLPDILSTDTNLRSTDRVLKLKVKDNTKPKSSMGTVDPSLFSGGHDLHLKMDMQTNLWSFRYSNNAILPEALAGQFTTFSKGYDQAVQYFERRNVEIAEVVD
jgi:hypothetical protein